MGTLTFARDELVLELQAGESRHVDVENRDNRGSQEPERVEQLFGAGKRLDVEAGGPNQGGDCLTRIRVVVDDGNLRSATAPFTGPEYELRHDRRICRITRKATVNPSLLCIVDDDLAMRESLSALFRSAGHGVRVFPSAESFLASDAQDFTVCLVADVFLPGMTGPELKSALPSAIFRAPIVFLTGRIDETTLQAESKAAARLR